MVALAIYFMAIVQYGIHLITRTGDCKGVKKYSFCHQKTTYLLMQVITSAKQISKITRGGLVLVMVKKMATNKSNSVFEILLYADSK